jgi:ribose-phosphate pyrophosphokinase
VEIAIFQPSPDSIHNDLFTIGMWADYLINKDSKSVLIMPYVPGARADRGEPFGLHVYAKFINNLLIDQIIIFDPHSQKAPELLKGFENLTVVYPAEFFEQTHVKMEMLDYTGIIAPDAGAELRAQGVADALGLPLYTAKKTRDFETGKLSGFEIDLPTSTEDDEFFLIVDDICDGGGTFIGLVDAIGLPFDRVDLFVSHGVFSKNALKNLSEKFEYVYTTNSYDPQRALTTRETEFQDEDDTFERFDVIRLLLSKIKY